LVRFTPSKRARLGARQLVAELRGSAGFRADVLAWWERHQPGELTGPDADPVTAAAAAVLTDAPDTAARVASVAERADLAAIRAERDSAVARVDKLTDELDRLRAELAEVRSTLRAVRAAPHEELERLRGRFRDQGARLRQAEDERLAVERELAELRRTARERVSDALAERDRARERAQAERLRAARTEGEAAHARERAHRARRADRARLELLLRTLSGAADGLRAELALGPDGPLPGPSPAELVGAASAAAADRAAAPVADMTALNRLLGLASAHLIVDGYNVTKTGYPELSLFDQRGRLLRALGVLFARTGAEITVVFDGASVAGRAARAPRGVRLLFSDPGVAADDVIVELVAAEPPGRPVVVASSDGEVVAAVARRGAAPVSSVLLLELLSRG
jgi:predicted RNA-binding protein with PIN domain